MRQMQARQMIRQYGLSGSEPAGRPLRRGRRATVNQWEQGLLFRHGRLGRMLEPGAHRYWGAGYTLRAVDMRPWVVLVPTQEVPTADGVPVKVTVSGTARVTDATTYVTGARDADQALYLAVQIALRELVAVTTVDNLLTGRGDLGAALLAGIRGLEALGIAMEQLEVRDISLPGELKRAQTEVLVARAQGTAALERARGETASLRSLANAARIAADNPALLQLRLLQQLDASSGHTVVLGAPPFAVGVASTSATPTASGSGSAPSKRTTRSRP